MDQLLSACLAFPPERRGSRKVASKTYDSNIRAYMNTLSQMINSTAWIRLHDGRNILEFLDPAVNSIPYAVALDKQLQAAGKDPKRLEGLVQAASDYLCTFDPIQMRYCGEVWSSVVITCLTLFESSGMVEPSPFVTALLRLDPSAGTFTFLHLRIVRYCLSAGVPSQALPVLDKDISAFPQDPPNLKIAKSQDDYLCDEVELSNSFITTQSGHSKFKEAPTLVFEYYLLGAQIYAGLRNYARARLFLEYILLSPTIGQATSFIQVEAYRKWVLVGLLAEGKGYPLPKTIDQTVLKDVRALSKAYDALAEDFTRRDWRKLQAEIDVGGPMWFEDGNRRLVVEVSHALQRYRIIDLQKTYAALPVSEVAKFLEIDSAALLPHLDNMIQQRWIDASLTSTDKGAILRFGSSVPAPEDDLEAQSQRIARLVASTRDADVRLHLTKEVSEHMKRAKKSMGAEELADAMDLTYDQPLTHSGDVEEDEDIMAA